MHKSALQIPRKFRSFRKLTESLFRRLDRNFQLWGWKSPPLISTICCENFHLIKISWFYHQSCWTFLKPWTSECFLYPDGSSFFLKVLFVPRWLPKRGVPKLVENMAGIDMGSPLQAVTVTFASERVTFSLTITPSQKRAPATPYVANLEEKHGLFQVSRP